MKSSFQWVVIVSLAVLPFGACGGGGSESQEPQIICVPGSGNCFNLDLFESNLIAEVQGQTVGYAYAISDDGSYHSSGSGGYSRTAADGSQWMGTDQRMNIASITKTITAIAALQVLHDKGIGLNSSISFFLPAHWTRGPNVNLITFRDLLQHRSGIRDISGACDNKDELTYAVTKARIASGIQAADHGTGCYQNVNFALFRILIPYLLGHTYPGNDTDDATQTANWYRDYVIQNVLTPSSVFNADVKPVSSTPTLAYPYPDNGINGQSPGDWTLIAGGGGWYMSAIDVNRILRRLRYTTSLLPATVRDEMLADGLGVKLTDVGGIGTAYKHNGVLGWQLNDTKWGLWTCYYMYPNGVEAVLFINCDPTPKFIDTILEDAWLNAWE